MRISRESERTILLSLGSCIRKTCASGGRTPKKEVPPLTASATRYDPAYARSRNAPHEHFLAPSTSQFGDCVRPIGEHCTSRLFLAITYVYVPKVVPICIPWKSKKSHSNAYGPLRCCREQGAVSVVSSSGYTFQSICRKKSQAIKAYDIIHMQVVAEVYVEFTFLGTYSLEIGQDEHTQYLLWLFLIRLVFIPSTKNVIGCVNDIEFPPLVLLHFSTSIRKQAASPPRHGFTIAWYRVLSCSSLSYKDCSRSHCKEKISGGSGASRLRTSAYCAEKGVVWSDPSSGQSEGDSGRAGPTTIRGGHE